MAVTTLRALRATPRRPARARVLSAALALSGGLGVGLNACVEKQFDTHCAPAACPGSCDEPWSCERSADCPAGSVCVNGVCGVDAFPVIGADTLVAGFDVPEFELMQTSMDEGRPRLQWSAPPGSLRVTCGLFTCTPEFDGGEGSGQPSAVRLSNAPRCVPRVQTFNTETSAETQVFSFELGDLEPAAAGSCSPALGLTAQEAAGASGYPVVELLRVGCWALDRNQVIAATRLVQVNVQELPDAGYVLRLDCAAAPIGSWCLLPGDLGVCDQGKCELGRTPSELPEAGAGGQGGEAATLPPEPVEDCEDRPDDVPCQSPDSRIGQCLVDRCVANSESTYLRPLVVGDCASDGFETEWLNCYPSPILGFGTCAERQCRVRCRTDEDCESALSAAGIDVSAQSTTCQRPEGSYLGVCMDRP